VISTSRGMHRLRLTCVQCTFDGKRPPMMEQKRVLADRKREIASGRVSAGGEMKFEFSRSKARLICSLAKLPAVEEGSELPRSGGGVA